MRTDYRGSCRESESVAHDLRHTTSGVRIEEAYSGRPFLASLDPHGRRNMLQGPNETPVRVKLEGQAVREVDVRVSCTLTSLAH